MTELAAATGSSVPENQMDSVEPPFEVRLSAVKSGATVLRGGVEIPVQEAQAANIQVDDGIEVVKPKGQNEQGYSILDFSNDLEVELFSNTSVFLNSQRQGAGGSTDVTLDLDRGHIFVHPNDQTDSRVTVQTLYATIRTLTAGAEFDVCQNDERTCVLVTKGVVEITANDEKNILKAGEAGFVLRNASPSAPICAPIPAFLAWQNRFRQFADALSLDNELSLLKQSPCPVTASGLPFDARLIYRDEFRHSSSGWDRGQIDSFLARYVRFDGRRYYEVQVQGPNDQYLAFIPNGRDYGDVNIDVRVMTEAATSGDFRYGTAFRRTGDHYYAFVISPANQTWHFLKSSSAEVETLEEGIDKRIRAESRNMLRVESYGSIFLLFINGRFVDWVRDADYPSGEAGLFVETLGSPDAIIRFDSIIVWDVPPLVLGPMQGLQENCFNTTDDDGDRLIDRADPDCQRLDSNGTALPTQTITPGAGTTRTPAPTTTARPPTNAPNTPIPTTRPPLPTILPPLPTIIAPLPTLLPPLPTLLPSLPTLLPPLPTIQLPLPTIQLPLPLPTIQLPLPLRSEPSTPTARPE